MYETEVNHSVESIETLPLEIRKRFTELRENIESRTLLPWGEHCTECVWPVCYTTCDLYSPRADGACRQFVDGMVRIDHKEGLSPYLLKIRFKQWAKLWTNGNLHLKPLTKAATQEWVNITLGSMGRNAPLPASVKPRVLRKLSYLRRQAAEKDQSDHTLPDYFLLECFNPNARAIALTYTVRLRDQNEARPFQTMIQVSPGYTRAKIALSEIFQAVDVRQPFDVEIIPNDCADTVLYFGLMDFVKERAKAATPKNGSTPAKAAKTLKCVVWDLDNTLWEGVLIEDGVEKIRLRQGVVDVIKQLDQRGILNSVASKNNPEDAMKVLRLFGLDEYFLYPQIKWEPKSQSIAQIAQLLNVGVDTLAFVDDQPFERAEVQAALPQVFVLDALVYASIPDLPECNVPVTAESTNRRQLYRVQEQRNQVMEAHQGDYLGFLKECHMRIGIAPLDDSNRQRVYELAQRTNQLNFSGNRYQQAELAEIMKSPHLETYVIDASDRFGQYGIVGFGVVDVREPRLLDLMFSCRIQGKRVEHAVLSFLLKRFLHGNPRDFFANYRKTAKNAPSGKVFDEVGFVNFAEHEGVTSLVFRQAREIPDDRLVQITVQGAE
jgi:FkbH-like protein